MASSREAALLGMNSGESLYKFIDRMIQPDTAYIEKCNKTIDKFVRFLQGDKLPSLLRSHLREKTTLPDEKVKKVNVKRILKTGSLGKATAVRGNADIDLILFLNGFPTVGDLKNVMETILAATREYIEKKLRPRASWVRGIEFKRASPFSVGIFLMVLNDDGTSDKQEIDLLPAVDVTESEMLPSIYQTMLQNREVRNYYSSALSPLQKQFVTCAPAKVKNLIRLLKYWAKAENVPVRSYFLELIVINHQRKKESNQDFKIDEYFREIMIQLADCASLAVSFDDNYNVRDYRTDAEMRNSKPYVLDPANPFRNVAPTGQADITAVRNKARAVLERL